MLGQIGKLLMFVLVPGSRLCVHTLASEQVAHDDELTQYAALTDDWW